MILHERISGLKWVGIALVLAGFVLLVPLIVRTEEHLEPALAPANSPTPANAEKTEPAVP